MAERLDTLINQEIEVVASGVTYRGTLKEVTEDEVVLLAETGWISISMDQVNSIRKFGEVPAEGITKDIPPEFYKEDEEEKHSRRENQKKGRESNRRSRAR